MVFYSTLGNPFYFSFNGSSDTGFNLLEYSFDQENWQTIVGGTNYNVVDKIYIRGTNNTCINGTFNFYSSNIGEFRHDIKCEGDLRELLDYSNPGSITSIGKKCFNSLFFVHQSNDSRAIALQDISEIIFPIISNAPDNCYSQMFYGQSYIRELPYLNILPASSVGVKSYYQMFYLCSNLIDTPYLSATTLGSYCYSQMFFGTSITEAWDLPATSVPAGAYKEMFASCTFLRKAPKIYATSVGSSSCEGMFQNCTAMTSSPSNLYPTTINDYSYRRMFYNCSSLTTIPEFSSATSIRIEGCKEMFCNCNSILNVSKLPISWGNSSISQQAFERMFANCTNLKMIPKIYPYTMNLDAVLNMFVNCSNLKISSTKTEYYTKPWSVDTGYDYGSRSYNMISGTGGTYTGSISSGRTYYIWDEPEPGDFNLYIGVNGKAKKVTKIYVGVNGKAKEVTAMYVGVNGKAKQI